MAEQQQTIKNYSTKNREEFSQINVFYPELFKNRKNYSNFNLILRERKAYNS